MGTHARMKRRVRRKDSSEAYKVIETVGRKTRKRGVTLTGEQQPQSQDPDAPARMSQHAEDQGRGAGSERRDRGAERWDEDVRNTPEKPLKTRDGKWGRIGRLD